MEAMITKIHASILYGYGYSLVDNEGNVWEVVGIDYDQMTIAQHGNVDKLIEFEEIGSTYKILCRPISQLTEEIEHDGKKFIPVKEVVAQGLIGTLIYENMLIHELKRPDNVRTGTTNQLKEWHFNLDFPSGTTQNLK